jgi:hypothetical protein
MRPLAVTSKIRALAARATDARLQRLDGDVLQLAAR